MLGGTLVAEFARIRMLDAIRLNSGESSYDASGSISGLGDGTLEKHRSNYEI